MMIRPATTADAPAIAAIYNPYICDSIITFEEQPVDSPEMAARIANLGANYPWLVYEQDTRLLGYAYAAPWKDRSAFRFACESSIYLAPEAHGRGIGTLLYRRLLTDLAQHKMQTVIAGISLPNLASIALHEKLGFRKVAHFEALGVKFSRHIDVGYWQRQLEPHDD